MAAMGASAWAMCTAPMMNNRNGGLKTCRKVLPASDGSKRALRPADNAWRATSAETGLRSRLQIVGGGGMGSGLGYGGGGDLDSQNQSSFQTSGGVSYDPFSGFQYNQQGGAPIFNGDSMDDVDFGDAS